MFKTIKSVLAATTSTVVTLLEAADENAQSIKELSKAGHVKATNVRINTEIQAKIDQDLKMQEFKKQVEDGKLTSALQTAVEQRTEAEINSNIDDLLASVPSDD